MSLKKTSQVEKIEEKIKFLESVSHEVQYAAKAKQHQLDKGYTNDAIKNMISGIKWVEAVAIAAEIPELVEGLKEKLGRILNRKLTIHTVKRIEELLTPEIENLRDAWESRDYQSFPIKPMKLDGPAVADKGMRAGNAVTASNGTALDASASKLPSQFGLPPRKAVVNKTPKSTPGFLGRTALVKFLKIHPTRRNAFFQHLTRVREKLGDDCWEEVTNPRPNCSHYLYRADSPKLKELASKYKKRRMA